MDWDKAAEQLRKPLDPKHVVKPTGQYGPKGDYVEGWHVINEANRIFGFNGWSYSTSLEKVCEYTNEKGNIEVGFICNCTVTVDGVTRQDVGYGSGAAKKPGDAYEGAVKEAVTDALKRALRTFGNPFGLALYDKSRENVSAPPVEPQARDPRKIADALIAQVRKCTSYDDITKTIGGDRFEAAWEWLALEKPPMSNEVKAAVNDMRSKFDPARQAPDDRSAA